MKYGDIVIRLNDNTVGSIVTEKKDNIEHYHFYPAGYGRYYISDLEEVNDKTVKPATIEEKIKYIETEFVWGTILQTIHIPVSDIEIIEYTDHHDNELRYHAYVNFYDTCMSFYTMDEAISGAIGYKHEGPNGKAAMYFHRMLKEE